MRIHLLSGCFLGLLALGLTSCKKAPAPDPQGFWLGTLQAGQLSLRLLLNVTKGDDGAYHVTADSVDQGVKGIPVSTFEVKDQSVQFKLAGLGASFQGEFKSKGTEMAGSWEQGGQSLPVVFRKTAHPPTLAAALPAEAYAPRSGSDLQGYWKGTLAVPGAKLRLAIKLAESPDGSYRGTLDSIDQGGRDLPMTAVRYTKPAVRLELDGIGGLFEGTLSGDGKEIGGDWTQGGRTTPLVFRQGEPETETGLPASAYIPSKEDDLVGYWHGALQIQGTKLRLGMKIARLPDGNLSGTLDSLDQGARDIPMTSVRYTNPVVQLEWKALAASYDGRMEGNKIAGTYQQAGGSLPLVLTRTNQPAAK